MPDLSRFAAFASRVGVVSPACSTCSTVAPGQVLQENTNENSRVALVAPVALPNSVTVHESDLIDAFEERAAIMEYDGGMSRQDAESLAWAEVFGSRARAA
ncbi:MAG TPA: hypothetical protein VGN91_00230 [Bosea sp. (in: a-proteobacteria)]|jgi:hypothetical protein|nr:hypothetical protein [Bosea sp. (in: a-proteobacteria)]